ncbi:hybrid sensor histidine kinase/response regulator [Cecembia lonarensis]|uniref:histidine kinase n=1 Tax=Cecembia lonarensis (strain CCUG 58316 / KCTC 22772 / LW9) TaxID=1225176 RepID=K1M4C8_CECL9|nr:response regulator [Cecembia lonarensis]EKB51109.1 Mycobacterial persistence regulator A [Cecembia lonarensis LW9]
MPIKILLIEDEQDLRQNISEMLEIEGFQVFQAINGIEGLELINKQSIDLVISDIMMPLLDGYQLLEIVRGNPSFSNLPFIFLSAKSSLKDQRLGMEKGAEDYLIKPIAFNSLLNAIHAALDKKQQREALIKEAINKAITSERKVKYHELRTPLFGLMGILDFLSENLDALDKNEIQLLVEKALDASNRLDGTLSKLYIYQKIADNEINLQYFPSLYFFVKEIVAGLGLDTVEIVNEGNDFSVSFDPKQLTFILTELLQNAIKFKATDDAKVSISFNEGRKITVTNTQNYLPPDMALSISPFCQYDRTQQEQQGLGLGLFIASKYCEKHHWQFKAETLKNGDFQVQIEFA